MQKKYKDLMLIGITRDKDWSSLGKTVEEMKTSCIIIPDGDKLFNKYTVKNVPDSYYIDKDGYVKYHITGYKIGSQDDIERRIKEILAESKSKSKYSR